MFLKTVQQPKIICSPHFFFVNIKFYNERGQEINWSLNKKNIPDSTITQPLSEKFKYSFNSVPQNNSMCELVMLQLFPVYSSQPLSVGIHLSAC